MLPVRAPSSPDPSNDHRFEHSCSLSGTETMQMPFMSPWYLPGISLESPWYLPGISLVCSWSPSSVSSPMLLRSGQAVVLAVAVVVAMAMGVHVIMHDCLRVMDRTVAVSTAGHASAFVIMKHQASEPFHFQTTTLRENEAQVLEISLEHHLRQIRAFVSIRLARW